MDKQEELVNAIAETLTLHANDEESIASDSILSGAILNLDKTARLGNTGFVIRLSDGAEFEIQVAQSR